MWTFLRRLDLLAARPAGEERRLVNNAQWKHFVTFLDSTGFTAAQFTALDRELVAVSKSPAGKGIDPHLVTETQVLSATLLVLTREKAGVKCS